MNTLNVPNGTLTQKVFDSVGEGLQYQKIHFTAGNHLITTPLKFNDGTIISGDEGAVLELMKHADPKVFKSMVPMLGQKFAQIKDILIENITFHGNSSEQDVAHGKGFHNAIGLTNVTNLIIRNITLIDTQGDVARITNGTNIEYYNNKIYRCGHDGLYVDGGKNVQAWGNYTELRTNSAIRLRRVVDGHIYNNVVTNLVKGAASSPGFQIEVSTTGKSSRNIVIENNYISGTYGPGIWAIATNNTGNTSASGIVIKNNYFENCGNMTYISGVGGIVCDGWHRVDIQNNVFDACRGYAVLFGRYLPGLATETGGTVANVQRNTIVNTKKSDIAGIGSGSGVCNLVPEKHAVTSSGNTFYNNILNYYKVDGTADIYAKIMPTLPPKPTTEPITEPNERESVLFVTCNSKQALEIQTMLGDQLIYKNG